MTEKDRFGDTLRDREKAAEDRYMAEQDRERLAKLREKNRSEHAGRGLCPRCAVELAAATEQQVAVKACPTCRGVWLDAETLELFLMRAREGEIERFVRRLLE